MIHAEARASFDATECPCRLVAQRLAAAQARFHLFIKMLADADDFISSPMPSRVAAQRQAGRQLRRRRYQKNANAGLVAVDAHAGSGRPSQNFPLDSAVMNSGDTTTAPPHD